MTLPVIQFSFVLFGSIIDKLCHHRKPGVPYLGWWTLEEPPLRGNGIAQRDTSVCLHLSSSCMICCDSLFFVRIGLYMVVSDGVR